MNVPDLCWYAGSQGLTLAELARGAPSWLGPAYQELNPLYGEMASSMEISTR